MRSCGRVVIGGEKLNSFRLAGLSCILLIVDSVCLAQGVLSQAQLLKRASHEFALEHYAEAERDFRELTRADPSNLAFYAYLAHALFRQKKYATAIGAYEKVLDLENRGQALSQKDHRILIDQLVMSYGMDGQMQKVHALVDQAIQQDPEYPLNYYNLACAYAEEGDKQKALANLQRAFDRKASVLKGEQMPDPRVDPSFQKYVGDPDFVTLMKKLGYK